jgi:coenzyme F420-0:L-glutamate ligase/coenzyme F420-1:gamma-L-glutamate ligase
MSAVVSFTALPGIGEVAPGADLAAIAADALVRAGTTIRPRDVLVVAQKIVSKAEDRHVRLASVVPSARALQLAAATGKDPRLVQLVLDESSEVLRVARNVLIVRHRRGFVMANAGIDRSNVGPAAAGDERVLLLPVDPDASASRLRDALHVRFGVAPGVIVSDSFGRPWRNGTTNVALGSAGLPSLLDRRGELDRDGRMLEVTQVACADALAAGAGLVMGEGAEGTPMVLVHGWSANGLARDASALIRPVAEDLFR